jgi:3-(3-hydroxy-phenyl)propionate hydroxylase
MNHISTDVIVIGAGPVGLTLANELVRNGVRPRIIDRAPAIREVSKALILHVRTQEMLDKVGVMDRIIAEARPLTEVVVHAYGKHIGSWHLKGIDGPYDHPLIIGQNRTQHHLEAHLNSQGVSVEWSTEAATLRRDERGADLTLNRMLNATGQPSEELVRASYVVGCEGSNSLVRKTMGFTFEGERYSGEQFIQADCKIRWAMPKGRSHLFLTKFGYLMVIEMPGDTVRIFISIPDAASHVQEANLTGAVEDISHEPTLNEIEDNLTRLTGIDAKLSDATWLARYRTSHRYANRFSEGRAFIAGDAGHVHVPIGGQGMNTGIQDAFNLGWKLAGVIRGVYHPSILDTYNDERHPVAEGLIHGTDFAYKGIVHPSELKQRAARLFGPFIVRSEIAQTFMRNTLEELKIAFHQTALNEDHHGGSGPKPGERVLDGDVVRWSNWQTVSLNELTRTIAWTLLLFGGTHRADKTRELVSLADQVTSRWPARVQVFHVVAATVPPSGYTIAESVLLDPYDQLHDKYGSSHPTLYLLRPDCVIGFRGRLEDADSLLGYLGRIFA